MRQVAAVMWISEGGAASSTLCLATQPYQFRPVGTSMVGFGMGEFHMVARTGAECGGQVIASASALAS
eukprot:628312-Pyramimonas_sp.AAC.2